MATSRMRGALDHPATASARLAARAGETDRAARWPVHVRIVHDDLANARAPVLVGHYDHDVIVAAERALDRHLAGRLSDLHRLDLYAGPLQTATVVLRDGDGSAAGGRHPGAIVAGLGGVGDLTPGRLTATLEQALAAYGEERLDVARRRRRGAPPAARRPAVVRAPVSAVLVGSGEAGVTLADSLQALLRAVAAANARLARSRAAAPGDRVAGPIAFIDRVDVLELYEDRAIEAVYALRAIARPDALSRFVLADRLTHGRLGQTRARAGAAPAWWQRIRVTADDHGALSFEALTQLARAHAALTSTQRGLVDAFVDRATSRPTMDRSVGHTLFELLMPNDLKACAPDRRNLVLVLNAGAAALPWELLHDRHDAGAAPLSVNSGMVRQLLTGRRRDRVQRAAWPTALVIGNPLVRDPRFANLPGAAREAQAVAGQLARAGYEVRALTGPAAHPQAVLSALHERPWRVVHLAAHGVFEHRPAPDEPFVSGLVLDDGVLLSPADIEQMRVVPDLVFINGCHLGRMRITQPASNPFPRLAASLAAQFIEMGVRAVVAAGWAIDDRAARAFAAAFYAGMFGGRTFGDAVVAARQRLFRSYRDTAVWGAYQCYGDPGFSLAPARTPARRERWAAWSEAVRWIDQVAGEANQNGEPRRPAAIAEIEAGLAELPPRWRAEPVLVAASAIAFGTLGDHARAVACRPAITRAERAEVSLETLERLAAFMIARSGELSRTPARSRRAATLLGEAETLLRALVAIGPTARRSALLGELHRSRALMARDGRQRRRAIEAMAGAYADSVRIAAGHRGTDAEERNGHGGSADARAERLAALAVLCWWPGLAGVRAGLARQMRTGLAEMRALAGTPHAPLWADYLLLSALLRGALTAPGRRRLLRTLRRSIDEAGDRGGRSAADRLQFIARMIPGRRNPRAATVRRLLDDLAHALA